ncbi:class I glutamine amidotransferase-like protein [Auriculariales sp. MPI-PUGE-AT-0066]|nr:class I glutamine amidotransferase-like protein [Auriculariales sp. MPI-PUGE-AT-0066]
MSTAPPAAETFTIAVCLFQGAQLIDFAAPIDLLGALEGVNRTTYWTAFGLEPPQKQLDFTYLACDKEPVKPSTGPLLTPEETYDEVLASGKQFDIIFVPGGMRGPDQIQPSLIKFLAVQVPQAKYTLTVCTGSWLLALAGVLDGRRATTNKAAFKVVQAATSKQIQWVPKARWVVDGNLWTSSGVTAGIDMSAAWLEEFVGPETAGKIATMVEYKRRNQDEDEFAAIHGLI